MFRDNENDKPIDFVRKYTSQYDFSSEQIKEFIDLVELFSEKLFLGGKNPESFTVAILYLFYGRKFNLFKTELCKQSELSFPTIQERITEIEEYTKDNFPELSESIPERKQPEDKKLKSKKYPNQIFKTRISEINIPKRLRELRKDNVENLAKSIKENGLILPIMLDSNKNLISGLHRLEAFKLLGLEEIPCVITDEKDKLKLQLMEIDENFVRTDFSKIEKGEVLKRRKEIYEMLYPETKVGIAGGLASGISRSKGTTDTVSSVQKSFAEDTAKKLGVSDRTINRYIQMVTKIDKNFLSWLKGTPISNQVRNLIKISRLSPEKQKELFIDLENELSKEEMSFGNVRDRIDQLKKIWKSVETLNIQKETYDQKK